MLELFKRKKKSPRAAGVYLHPQGLILHAQRRATSGVLLHGEHVVRFPKTAPPSEIGRSLREVLAAYREGVPHPTDWKNQGKEFLKNAGFKSWKALQAPPCKSCWIEQTEDAIVFTPLRNGGSRGEKKGFQPFGAQPVVTSPQATDQQLGETLLKALEISETV